MVTIQITVLKTYVFKEFQHYCNESIQKCPVFKEGQVYVTTYEKPEGFCDWAWRDLYPYITSLMTGGNFSENIFDGWMKDKDTMIAGCTDGIRPVVFEIKRLRESSSAKAQLI